MSIRKIKRHLVERYISEDEWPIISMLTNRLVLMRVPEGHRVISLQAGSLVGRGMKIEDLATVKPVLSNSGNPLESRWEVVDEMLLFCFDRTQVPVGSTLEFVVTVLEK